MVDRMRTAENESVLMPERYKLLHFPLKSPEMKQIGSESGPRCFISRSERRVRIVGCEAGHALSGRLVMVDRAPGTAENGTNRDESGRFLSQFAPDRWEMYQQRMIP